MIASGLARGIDTAAHLAALELGTIAVLAAGIDNVYPPENEELHRAIAEQGLLISERAPSFSPRGKDFPRRNRLISGSRLAWSGLRESNTSFGGGHDGSELVEGT